MVVIAPSLPLPSNREQGQTEDCVRLSAHCSCCTKLSGAHTALRVSPAARMIELTIRVFTSQQKELILRLPDCPGVSHSCLPLCVRACPSMSDCPTLSHSTLLASLLLH